ncbi:MAG: hypothetical protein V3V99_01900 [candidate division Zixibacteria bacterium]
MILRKIILTSFIVCFAYSFSFSQDVIDDSPDNVNTSVVDTLESMNLHTIIDTTIMIPQLEFVENNLDDALKALVRAYELSVFIDTSVAGTITLRLDNVSLNDALLFIIKEYALAWEKTGEIIKIYKPFQPPPPPAPLEIVIDNGLLNCNLKNTPLQKVIDELIDLAGVNIIIESGTSGIISGRLQGVMVDKALNVLMTSNGFTIRSADGIYYIGVMRTSGEGGHRASRFSIHCDNNLVTVNVTNAPLGDILSAIADNCGTSFFMRGTIEGSVNASFSDLPLDDALVSLLRNTQYTYKKDNDLYFIGAKNSQDMFVTKLILLKHLVANTIEPLIPTSLTSQVSLKVIVEHNGLIVVGPKTVIDDIRLFLEEVDIPPAMVLFDVLVVDYSTTDIFQFDLLMNNTGTSGNIPTQNYYPNIDMSGTGKTLQDDLDWVGNQIGVSKIGPLSDDFFARLQIMQQEGKANIRSRPKISSLCGHSASINVGTTQYYLLETKIVHPSAQSDVSTQTSQRFEKIEANMSIEVTPFVNETGELIVEIKPEFSTPAAAFDSEIPPTINHRILHSTVRLRNGETIILGGLVQESENKTIKKFPILGSLPFIGPLFQSTHKTTNQSELMIYITPHVYYGNEQNIDLESLIDRK